MFLLIDNSFTFLDLKIILDLLFFFSSSYKPESLNPFIFLYLSNTAKTFYKTPNISLNPGIISENYRNSFEASHHEDHCVRAHTYPFLPQMGFANLMLSMKSNSSPPFK